MKHYRLVSFDHHFKIPPSVAVCPYCQKNMFAQVNEWEEDEDNLWTASGIETTCESEPDFDEENIEEFREFVNSHSEMPYVYKLPVDEAIKKYINKCFRFKKEETILERRLFNEM